MRERLAYTLDETAEALGVSRGAINRLVKEGKLRVSRLGHRTLRVSVDATRDCLRTLERKLDAE
jgi:excisionase family DNA binding protein